MSHYGLVSEQSRKAKSARNLYEYLRHKVKQSEWLSEVSVGELHGEDGIPVGSLDKYRILNLRLHDEHLSPYFQTDMNLFHMLMLDESADTVLYRHPKGWLFVFEGIPTGPKPFGQMGFDTR